MLTFGVSGKLIMNVLVMYDRETNSLWSQILGKAVDGPLNGTQLTPLAAMQTTWAQWKALHPDTRALETGGRGRFDSYDRYYDSGQTGVIGETRTDERLPRKELIVGVVVEEQPVAYSRSVLRVELAVNDVVADVPLLVFFDPPTASGLVYRREVEGQVLTFTVSDEDPLILFDEETNSRWRALTGVATDGPLAGKGLERIPSTSSFWFGWKDWHPGTLVYGQ